MLTALFGFIKTVVVKVATWIADTVRSIIVDTAMSSILNNN